MNREVPAEGEKSNDGFLLKRKGAKKKRGRGRGRGRDREELAEVDA
jgi:hypothetical protein